MFPENMPKILSKLLDTIETIEHIYGKDFTIEKKIRQGERALYFKNQDGNYLLYFGIWYDLWLRYQHPLWFGVDLDWSREVVSKFTRMYRNRFVEYENHRLCYIDQHRVSEESFSEDVALILGRSLKTDNPI
jgi:hypothetical protein